MHHDLNGIEDVVDIMPGSTFNLDRNLTATADIYTHPSKYSKKPQLNPLSVQFSFTITLWPQVAVGLLKKR